MLEQVEIWALVFTIDSLRYFIGVGLVSSMLLAFKPWVNARRIQKKRRASSKDIRREIAYSILTIAVYATVALFSIYSTEHGYSQMYYSVSEMGWWYTLLSLPLLAILHDAYFYWCHRTMHHPKLFARTHHIHHLSRTPTPWAAYSFSPIEALIMALFIPLVLHLIPLHSGVIFVYLIFMILRNAIGHCGFEVHPVSWVDGPFDVFTTVTHHDMHHQALNGNFGLYFTWWDRWMGTELAMYKSVFRSAIGEVIHDQQNQVRVAGSQENEKNHV